MRSAEAELFKRVRDDVVSEIDEQRKWVEHELRGVRGCRAPMWRRRSASPTTWSASPDGMVGIARRHGRHRRRHGLARWETSRGFGQLGTLRPSKDLVGGRRMSVRMPVRDVCTHVRTQCLYTCRYACLYAMPVRMSARLSIHMCVSSAAFVERC